MRIFCWKSGETKWLSDSHFVLNGIFKNNAITFAYFPKTRWLLDLHWNNFCIFAEKPMIPSGCSDSYFDLNGIFKNNAIIFAYFFWGPGDYRISIEIIFAYFLKIQWNQVIIRPLLINHEGKKHLNMCTLVWESYYIIYDTTMLG